MPANSDTEPPLAYEKQSPETPSINNHAMPKWDVDDDVVISGIAGRFPESDNLDEFKKNLYDKVDMVTVDARRWEPGLLDLPARQGKMKEINKFDSKYFDVPDKEVVKMDPALRILLEVVYETFADAGYSAESMRGKRVGVFVGQCTYEAHVVLAEDPEKIDGYTLTGCSLSMLPNQVSFHFDLNGPSLSLDTACSSAMYALNLATLSIRSNQCDAAIVAGVNVMLNPGTSIGFLLLGMLGKSGKCNAFDASGDGYVRSESVSALLLQKASDARRIYATVLHSKTNVDGAKEMGITFPSASLQNSLIRATYQEAKIKPKDVAYLEAHGTGTKAGDPEELSSVTEFFCEGRTSPLPIGSVKSNMGHSEGASGLSSIAKLIISLENGMVPPNLHYQNPNPNIPGLLDGRLKVVTEPFPIESGSVVALNSFGFGGSNVHVILKGNPKNKTKITKFRIIPRLTLCCGRTAEAVDFAFQKIVEDSFADEALLFLEEVSQAPTRKMPYRGFALIEDNVDKPFQLIERTPMEKKPIWFLFSGVGSQWAGMAKDMMKVEAFAKSIRRSAEVVQPLGINLVQLVTEGSENDLLNITACFVSIAAVQIALVSILNDLGVVPDGIVGHSAGELGCALADGGFTPEQMLMTAYWRGQCCLTNNIIPGGMAAVGLTWDEALARCPDGVVPACHNAEDSVTISGPIDQVRRFTENLGNENVFAREVNSCNMPFHSSHMRPIEETLKKALNTVIPYPKPRSKRWISSSVSEDNWNKPLAKKTSSAYFVNNMISPVLFHDALTHVPENAIVIEIAPHGLLQAIVKRRLGQKCSYVSLMKRNHPDNVEHLLSSIGRLYNLGLHPRVKNLYPPVTFPVPNGTPSISSLVKWDHSRSWETVSAYDFPIVKRQSDNSVLVDCSEPNSPDYYVIGHEIDGRVLYPATGYLMLAWKALAKKMQTVFDKMPVVFENVTLHRATLIPKLGNVRFKVNVMPLTGKFEIIESGSIAVSGRIYVPNDASLTLEQQVKKSSLRNINAEQFVLESKEFYKELRLRGYEYGPTFQGVLEAESSGLKAKLRWDGNWVTFMDTMLQFSVLSAKNRLLNLPTAFENIRIDPKRMPNPEQVPTITVYFDPYINVCATTAIEMEGLTCTLAPRRHAGQKTPVLEQYRFVPNFDTDILSKREKNTILEYVQVCSSVTRKIMEVSGWSNLQIHDFFQGQQLASKDVVDRYVNLEKDDFALLRNLASILCELPNKAHNLKELIRHANRTNPVSKDILFNALLNEKALRSSIDLVIENTPNAKKMQILEAAVDQTIAPWALKYITNYHMDLEADYTLGKIQKDSELDLAQFGELVKIKLWDLMSDDVPSRNNDLVLTKGLCGFSTKDSLKSSLQELTNIVKVKGFIILVERTLFSPAEKFLRSFTNDMSSEIRDEDIEKTCEELGCAVVGKKTDNLTGTIYILRKNGDAPVPFPKQTMLKVLLDDYKAWLDPLKKEVHNLESASDGENLWLVAEKPFVGVVGLVNCLRHEAGGKKIRCLFDANFSIESMPDFNPINPFYTEVISKDLIMNVYRDGQWGTFRHVGLASVSEVSSVPTEHAYLNVLTRGDLSSLRFFQSSNTFHYQNESLNGRVLCHVYYGPLNFKDIMIASGKLPPAALSGDFATEECILGCEFAGREDTKDGRRVMGLVANRGLATTVLIDPEFVWSIPERWTMEEASTVPVVYATAYYALLVRGKMKRGESILIHSGSGGVGQAAISIALSMGCKVFTTVGSNQKREYLKKRFPQLQDRNFSNSRDVMFEYEIMKETNGRGVDLVLNSLSEEKLQASVRCLSQYGRFLEIGKYDLFNNNPLLLSPFLKGITFHGVLLDATFVKDPSLSALKKELVDLVNEGIKNGTVRPLETTVFGWDEAEAAFRFMATGKHIGKVVLKFREEEEAQLFTPLPLQIPAIPRSICHPKKTYVIVGGLGGFGLELGNWLIGRGCKRLVVTSRTGIRNGFQKLCLKRWKKAGTRVDVSTRDVTTTSGSEELIKESMKLGPIGGVFNLAMVLKDALLENQTVENFIQVTDPKVKGTLNLDRITRVLCPELEWFVAFSSISCGRGNAGQTNYAFANSAMERICEKRRTDGLPGLAIQWGLVGDVGIVQETIGSKDVVVGGCSAQRIANCLSTLDFFLQISGEKSGCSAVVSSFVPAERASVSTGVNEKKDLLRTIGHILGLKDTGSLNDEMTLGDLGLDSLMGVEIKQTLEREYDLNLTSQDIRNLSVKRIIGIGGGQSQELVANASLVDANDSLTDSVANKEIPLKNLYGIQLPEDVIIPLNKIKSGEAIFMVHPIEGISAMFKTISSHLNVSSLGLQCTAEAPLTTVQDLALFYFQRMKLIQPIGPYSICGYSFGSMVAFELALLIQRELGIKGGVKTLTLLDGAPEWMKITVEQKIVRMDNVELEGPVSALRTFVLHYTDKDTLKSFDELDKNDSSFESHLSSTSNIIINHFGDSKSKVNPELFKEMLKSYCFRLYASYKYEVTSKFRGDVTLIKASQGVDATTSLSNDYGLSKIVEGNVDARTVEANHVSLLKEPCAAIVADIINNQISSAN